MTRLDGKRGLVTGAASGIGKATAERLAEEGAAVLATDIQDDAGEAVAADIRERGGDAVFLHHDVSSEEGAAVLATDIQDDAGEAVAAGIRERGGQAVFLHHDVSSEDEWIAAVERATGQLGGLDILVNNAGIGDLHGIENTSKEDYDRTIAVTQTSVFLGMKHAGDALKASGNASVVNVSSIFGASGGFGGSPAYHAAKGAVRILTKNVALRWATEGVRVNSVHPGFIDTPIIEQAMGTPIEEAMLEATPMGRLGRPEEIAAVIAFLASDDASFMTGSEVYVDGGYLAR